MQDLFPLLRAQMDRAAALAEPDWRQYFESILAVCPWALAAWDQGRIRVCEYTEACSLTEPYVACVYILRDATVEQLQVLVGKYNTERPGETWLYSHPQDGNNSTPLPVLIQQDTHYLEQARSRNQIENYKRNPR